MSASYGEPLGLGTSGEARARVSWSAIFAGVVVVVAVQLLLSVLGAGIGLGMTTPSQADGASVSRLGTGAGLWWLGSTVLSLIAGSYAAARLAGVGTRFDGVLHGIVVWGLALLLTVYLITSAVGGVARGAFSVIGSSVSAAGSVLGSATTGLAEGGKAAAPQIAQSMGLDANALQNQAERLLQSPTPQDPAAMNGADAAKAVAQALPDVAAGGDKAAAAKQRITAIVAAQAHISPDDARKRVDDAQAQFEQSKAKAIETARQAADQAASGASQASFIAFVGLVIGLIAATVGGAIASPRTVASGRFR